MLRDQLGEADMDHANLDVEKLVTSLEASYATPEERHPQGDSKQVKDDEIQFF